ncbi:hypothetical protein ABEB22_05655 [Thioclava sp. 'Guangxiensis']|uniref:hypothetical protein n=1 Tax=Thioclava sp. 'Guangxiensis' TaxID=3149044 RepID=UPI003877CFDC
MPLDRLIELIAEAAARKLIQEREAKEATPKAMSQHDATSPVWPQEFRKLFKRLYLQHRPCPEKDFA